jgi:Secretion system C-terminal sorting domain
MKKQFVFFRGVLNKKFNYLKFIFPIMLFFFTISIHSNAQSAYGSYFNYNCNDTYEPIGGSSVSSINSNGLTLFNKKIIINGNFIVDKNLTLYNCKVQMGPNATIDVKSNVRFTAIQTVFASCNSTWNAILLRINAGIQFNTCLFRDANAAAIVFTPGYKPLTGLTNVIVNCVFANDRIGISSDAGAGSSSINNLSPMKFTGNKFLKSEEPLPTGVPRVKMERGMSLIKTTGVIGTAGTPNLFNSAQSGSKHGIFVSRSTVTVTNCEFKAYQQGAEVDLTTMYGIYAIESNLTVDNSSGKCIFRENTRGGILSEKTKTLVVKKADFYDAPDGGVQLWAIRCINNDMPANITIEENFVDYYEKKSSGIEIHRPATSDPTAPNISVKRNKIYLDGGGGQSDGIFVTPGTGIPENKMYIEGNEVHIRGVVTFACGIRVYGKTKAKGYKILNNKVLYETPYVITNGGNPIYTSWGIALIDANSGETVDSPFAHEINGNTVDVSTYSAFPSNSLNENVYSMAQCGIHLESSPHTTVKGNTVTNAYRDFHIWKNNSDCDFRCNTMNFANYGLSCDDTDIDMSDQTQKGNLWASTSYAHLGAVAWKRDGPGLTSPLLTYPNFRFFVNPNIIDHKPDTWLPVDWFVDDTQEFPGCGGNIINEPPIRYFTPSQTNILYGIPNNGFTSVRNWDERREMNTSILSIPAISSQSLDAVNWKNSQLNSSAYKFSSIENDLAAATVMPLSTETILRQVVNIEAYHFNQLVSISQIIENGSTDSVALGIQLQVHVDSLQSLQEQYQNIVYTYEQQKMIALSLVKTNINTLPDTASFEFARKKWLKYKIKKLMGDSLAQADINDLIAIANSCILDLGATITDAARSIPYEQGAVYWSDENLGYENCPLGDERQSNVQDTKAQKIQITPNPANQQLEVRAKDKEAQINQWEIVDMLGRSYGRVSCHSNTITIPISDLPSGNYTIRGIYSNGTPFASRFIIVH